MKYKKALEEKHRGLSVEYRLDLDIETFSDRDFKNKSYSGLHHTETYAWDNGDIII